VAVSLVEWILKKVGGPDEWRPAGAVRVLPPSALVYDAQEAPRAEAVFQHLARLGFQPTKVPPDSLANDLAAGLAHASSARVRHCTRLLNVAVLLFALLALVVGVGLAGLAWAWLR
jgi:hypothetical protein